MSSYLLDENAFFQNFVLKTTTLIVMKKSLLAALTFMFVVVVSKAQTTILNFESAASSTTFQYFGSPLDGSLTETIANPNAAGINTSATVLKYVKPEVERINRIEEARNARYLKAVEEYEDSHKDEEMEALRLGLDPTPITLQSANKGTAMEGVVALKPGEWYATGQHKTPGLTYYWQEKIKINPGDRLTLVLNDANSMLITGGW